MSEDYDYSKDADEEEVESMGNANDDDDDDDDYQDDAGSMEEETDGNDDAEFKFYTSTRRHPAAKKSKTKSKLKPNRKRNTTPKKTSRSRTRSSVIENTERFAQSLGMSTRKRRAAAPIFEDEHETQRRAADYYDDDDEIDQDEIEDEEGDHDVDSQVDCDDDNDEDYDHQDDEEFEEEEYSEEDDEDYEDDFLPSQRSPRKKNKTNVVRKSSSKSKSKHKSPRNASSKTRTPSHNLMKKKDNGTEDSPTSASASASMLMTLPYRQPGKRQTRAQKRAEEDGENNSTMTRRSSRKSTQRAKTRIAVISHTQNISFSDDSDDQYSYNGNHFNGAINENENENDTREGSELDNKNEKNEKISASLATARNKSSSDTKVKGSDDDKDDDYMFEEDDDDDNDFNQDTSGGEDDNFMSEISFVGDESDDTNDIYRSTKPKTSRSVRTTRNTRNARIKKSTNSYQQKRKQLNSPEKYFDDSDDGDYESNKDDDKYKSSFQSSVCNSDDDNESFKSDIDDFSEEKFGTHKKKSKSKQKNSRAHRLIPKCTSTVDEITLEKLNSLHICYLAPDNKTRHCFNLDTLYRSALMSGRRHYDPNSGNLNFLQPPHFRTVMDGYLLDQIASRFGRKALIIEESAVFKKEQGLLNRRSEFEMDESDTRASSFRDRFEAYMSSQMGNGDIYCCPLCYSEAHRRFHGGEAALDDDDDEDSFGDENGENEKNSHNSKDGDGDDYDIDKVTASRVDPMTILGSVDEDEFGVASMFCFKKVADLKKHLKTVHTVNPSTLAGNDLFKRFQIRAQDGLVQRHLHAYWRGQVLVGAMQRYWYEGHNQSYILLRYLIEERNIDHSSIPSNEKSSGDIDLEFCFSFPNRAKKIWNRISAPYEKGADSDLCDFIDEDENIGNEGIRPMPHAVESADANFEDNLVQELRRRRKLSTAASGRSDSESSFSSSSIKYDADSASDHNMEKASPKNMKNEKSTSSNDADADDDDDEHCDPAPTRRAATSKRRRIMESDEE